MYDVIVIGVGSMGSSACYHLASCGAKVLGLEQFGISHENGSHTGQSRLIRRAYFEHSDYVPLLHKAYEGWKAIEQESKRKMYWETGIAYFGLPDCDMLSGIRKSAHFHHIPIDQYSPDQIKMKWPQFNLPEEYTGFFEPEAGFLTPELAIQTITKLATEKGAVIRENEKVLDWSIDGKVKVTTNKGTYLGKKIIFTAGAFSEELIKIKIPLKVTQQFLGWTSPIESPKYHLGSLPCWMISEEDKLGPCYGFPELRFQDEFQGMKIAYHREGEVINKELNIDRLENEERILLDTLLKKYFPNIHSPISMMKKCKYSYSPDHDFIVDQLSEYDNKVILASGFSGHGFKFVPVIGEALADLALNGETDLPIHFLGLNRFQ